MQSFGAKPVYDIEKEEYHASAGEFRRWKFLLMLQDGGAISGLTRQPKIDLEPGISWRLDSTYIENGRRLWEDYKPRPFTPRENLLMRLWKLHGPGLLRIIDEKHGKYSTRKEIMGGGK